uniref:Uncharacterized protein n=1 Tax=Polynucleobacter necessarius subsp. necessarius (strain STIR1) TaxID=452638 RepID=B1XVY6_POLNS
MAPTEIYAFFEIDLISTFLQASRQITTQPHLKFFQLVHGYDLAWAHGQSICLTWESKITFSDVENYIFYRKTETHSF